MGISPPETSPHNLHKPKKIYRGIGLDFYQNMWYNQGHHAMLRVMDYPLRVRRHVKLSMTNLYIAHREMYRRGTRATPARPYPAVHKL